MDVDLLALAKEGWRARRKKVKGGYYISLRKGGQEKGLGPYTDTLWMQLQDFGMTPQSVQNVALVQDDNAAIVAMQQQIDDLQAQNIKSEIKLKRLREYVNKRLKGLNKRVKEQEKKKFFWKDVISEERGASLRDLELGNEIVMDFMVNWVKRLDKKIEIIEKEMGFIPA